MRGYKGLVVWQKARALTREVYAVTEMLPGTERFGLTNQIRRAAVSIPSNIAEGYGRQYRTEYIRFLNIARGSCYEVETQLILCVDLGYLGEKDTETALGILDEIGRILSAMIHSLQNTSR